MNPFPLEPRLLFLNLSHTNMVSFWQIFTAKEVELVSCLESGKAVSTCGGSCVLVLDVLEGLNEALGVVH